MTEESKEQEIERAEDQIEAALLKKDIETAWIHKVCTRADLDYAVLKPFEMFLSEDTIADGALGCRQREQNHTRLYLIRTNAKYLCPIHNKVEPVADFFRLKDGNILQLECGTRRGERI